MNAYQPTQTQKTPGQFISIEDHDMSIKQYRITLTMIKNQNNALIEKMKMQITKANEQYKMVKDWILSTEINESS